MNPKISIITISYNSAKTIEKTIESVLSQDYDKLEYLIIDGGSKDNTINIVNKYRDKIDYVISEPDKGISDAFNKGIKASTGDIIGIINSDDILLPGALNYIVENYSPEIDVYLGNVIIFNPDTLSSCIAVPSLEYNVKSRNIVVCHPSTFITQRAYKKFGDYKIHFRYMMDMDMLIRLYQGGVKFKRINKPLARFTCGGVTDNTAFLKGIKEYRLMLKDNGASNFYISLFIVRASIYRLIKEVCILIGIWDYLRKIKYNK